MKVYHSNNFKIGRKIVFDNEPYIIDSSEFVKPGKGQAFVRLKLRKFSTQQLIEKTFKSTDVLEQANVTEHTAFYLYNDGNFWFFIKNHTFEELLVEKKIIGSNKKWLLEQDQCSIILWNDQVISVEPNTFVKLEVINTTKFHKNNNVNNSTKLVELSTGAIVKVPIFIQIGEFIKIDTRSGEYVSRTK
ncbi:MAG: elongation factor P [Buchnera aphidicola (Pentalonia nigronervosa)]|jgi:elongation factor P|uniref:Elongation factor P n=1 Tax=Buchnera aphidicola (Pentalonia nigronervosa) TaxID=1309793 RepID=A0A7H1AZ72_9GAMM|nr:MAG: elongation factor P [Buchnera aphidicola (Pentalonia nigronervosa)]